MNITSPGAGTPTGTVTFNDNGASIGTAALTSGTTATLTAYNLIVGTHPITAIYAGDANFIGSTSNVFNQWVGEAQVGRVDYLLTQCPQSYVSPGGDGISQDGEPCVRLSYWNVPPTVRPGETVKSSIEWETLGVNPNAVVYATVFGDWVPDEALAQLHQGLHGSVGTVVWKEFEFTAPANPGIYRIRWTYAMAYKPLPSFYSQQDGGADNPGCGWWSEVVFEVLPAPVGRVDYLLTQCPQSYVSPGGDGISQDGEPCVRLSYWNVPPTVRPGETVKSSIEWETLGVNPNAVVYATVFGDWVPDDALAQLYQGLHGSVGTVVREEFQFTAPTQPGRYRLRWTYAMAYEPLPSFYSQEDGGADNPGCGWWSEVVFQVQPEPVGRVDYLLTQCPQSYVSPGGDGISQDGEPCVRLSYWNVPPTVRPGETVKSSIEWETLGVNPNAVVYATVFGDWVPDDALAQLYQGLHGSVGTVVREEFQFTAPTQPGRYRLRWTYAMAYKPLPSFYSQQDGGAADPGVGWWSEVVFEVQPAGSTTVVTNTTDPSVFGQDVTFTATVSISAPAAEPATGSVGFWDGGIYIGGAVLAGGTTATLTPSAMTATTHTITAVYSGDGNTCGSTSANFLQTVNQASTTTTVTSSVNPSVFGHGVTFTATCSGQWLVVSGQWPTGTVTFSDGSTSLGTASLVVSGSSLVAQLTTNNGQLTIGTHSITAVYGGDTNFFGSTSSSYLQTVVSAYIVTNTSNSSTVIGSLPWAVRLADLNGSGPAITINFDPVDFATAQNIALAGTLNLGNGISDESIIINGPAAPLTIQGGGSGSDFSVFTVAAGTTASLENLTISNGHTSGNGGGILNNGTLTVSYCTFSGNSAQYGGGIYNLGTVTVGNSTLSGNTGEEKGGGIYNSFGSVTVRDSTLSSNAGQGAGNEGDGNFGGGAIYNWFGTLTVSNSTITHNYAPHGAGIWNQGIVTVSNSTLSDNYTYTYWNGYAGGIYNAGTITVSYSTLSGNYARQGGAIFNSGTLTVSYSTLSGNYAETYGGGIESGEDYNGRVTVSNSTIAGNSAGWRGGAIDIQDAEGIDSAVVTVSNSTIAGNSAGSWDGGGGGIYNRNGTLTLDNAIVARNSATGTYQDIYGLVTSTSSYNLIGDGTGMSGISNGVNHNQVGTSSSRIDPLLAPLGNYGGPTQTMALLVGSPAIGAGEIVDNIHTDQRGYPRPASNPDIGAYQTSAGWQLPAYDLLGTRFDPIPTTGNLGSNAFLEQWSAAGNTALTGDLNGDGSLELVVGDGSNIRIYSGSGSLLNTLTGVGALDILADVTGDGRQEILVNDRVGTTLRIRAVQ